MLADSKHSLAARRWQRDRRWGRLTAGKQRLFTPVQLVLARIVKVAGARRRAWAGLSGGFAQVGRRSGLAALAAYAAIAQILQDQGLTIVHERLFGSLSQAGDLVCPG